jgi:phosphoribosylanthranilate isomerase
LLECASPFDDAAGLLFDAFQPGDLPGGTGQAFDWSRLTGEIKARLRPPIVLSGGLDPGNVARAIRSVRPYAVDVSSGVEERDAEGRVRRGYKDAARIAAFMRGVRSADDA